MSFPFQAVYDCVAQMVIDHGISTEIFEPMLLTCFVQDDSSFSFKQVPDGERFFASNAAKNALSQAIQHIMGMIAHIDANAGLVLVTEAFMKVADRQGDETVEEAHKRNNGSLSLADDPESKDCIIINIITPAETQVGFLPISKDRKITYQPLMGLRGVGRLTNKPV